MVLRRTQLPSAMVDVGDFSLWSLLRKNIGKGWGGGDID